MKNISLVEWFVMITLFLISVSIIKNTFDGYLDKDCESSCAVKCEGVK